MNFNTNKRPRVYLEKVNNVWVIETPNGLARDTNGTVLTFTDANLEEGKQLVRNLKSKLTTK